jgi:hypothetical protein
MVMKKSLLGFLVVGLIFLGVLWQAHSSQVEGMEDHMTASERYSMNYQPIPIEGSADIINKPVFLKWLTETDLLNYNRWADSDTWGILTDEIKYQSNPNPLVKYVSLQSTEGKNMGLALPLTIPTEEQILLLTVPETTEKEVEGWLLEMLLPQEMHKRLVKEKKLIFKVVGSELKETSMIERKLSRNPKEMGEQVAYFSDYTMRGMMQLYVDRIKMLAKTGQKDTLSILKINHFSLVRLKQWEVTDISVAEKPVVFAKLTTIQPVGVALWVEKKDKA